MLKGKRKWITLLAFIVAVFLLRVPQIQAAMPQFSSVDRALGAKAVAKLRSSPEFKAFLKDLNRAFEPEPGGMVFGQEKYVIVAVPIAYMGKHLGTNFTLVLDRSDLSVLASTAMKVTPTPLGHHAQIWRSGNLLADLTVDDGGTVVNGWRSRGDKKEDLHGQNFVKEGKGVIDQLFQNSNDKSLGLSDLLGARVAHAGSISCLNNCLASAGIPTYLLTFIAAICAIACAATFGFGCYVCAAGVLGGYAGIGLACLRKCGYLI